MTLNKLVKLTTLWTTWPWYPFLYISCVSYPILCYLISHQKTYIVLTHFWVGFYRITKTCLYNFVLLKSHFYTVKLGFTGVYVFLFLLKNIDCGYSLELPCQGGSNKYPQYMFWAEIWKIFDILSENFHFLVVKFSVYIVYIVFTYRHVFVMGT